MFDTRMAEHLRHYINAEVAMMIAQQRQITPIEGLRLFLDSETYKMLADDELEMWEFSPLAFFDMWENEIKTGDPRNSFYLRSDNYG